MADYYQQTHLGRRQPHQVSTLKVVSASVAAVAIGGPMLGMMGLSFLASTTLLLVCSPLLLLFSPLLLGVAFVFVAALAGFAVAAAMALTALSIFGWIAREAGVRFSGLTKLGDSGHMMKRKRGDYWTDNNFASSTA